MLKSLKILESATFKFITVTGYECYKESNDRYYYCFVNKQDNLNDNIKYTRISKDVYKLAEMQCYF